MVLLTPHCLFLATNSRPPGADCFLSARFRWLPGTCPYWPSSSTAGLWSLFTLQNQKSKLLLQVSRGIAKARAHSSQLSLPQLPTATSHSQLPSRSPFISRASKPRVNGRCRETGCETLDARECPWVSWCVGCQCRDGSGCIGGGSGPSPRDASHSQLPSRSPFISRAAADVYSSAAQSKPRVKGGCETLDARECLWVSWCVGCHCLDGSGCGGGSGVGGVFGSRQGTSHSSITSMWCKLALIVGASPSCWQLPDRAVGGGFLVGGLAFVRWLLPFWEEEDLPVTLAGHVPTSFSRR